MLEFLSRLQLERRGLSNVKRRRTVIENEFVHNLQYGGGPRAILFLLFALASVLFIRYARDPEALYPSDVTRMALVVVVIIGSFAVHYYVNHTGNFLRNNRVLLTIGVLFFHLFLLKIAFTLGAAAGTAAEATARATTEAIAQLDGVAKVSEVARIPFEYLFPAYAFAPMVMSILLGRNHGTLTAIYASLLGAMLVPADMAFNFMVMSLVSGFVAVYLTHQVRRRSKVIRAGLFVGIATTILAIATGEVMIQTDWKTIAIQCGTTLLAGTLMAMLISGLLPMLESLFRITTDVSWLEMADLNHPLLRRLTYEAPGTYHHSLVVARLSEAAADTIGANGMLCRVASYFHDIGKLTKPQYFIENIDNDENPHDELTPTMSALIIIAHVKDGVDLALKHRLNNEIISVIREHHGTSLVQYFYDRARKLRREQKTKQEEGKAKSDDLPAVEEKNFRYPGPKPQTRESAIISLADSIESASRSLSKPSPPKIEQLIDEITKNRIREGQLDECGLTFADLSQVKASFLSTLSGMSHTRVSYKQEGVDEKTSGDGAKQPAEGKPELKVVEKDDAEGSKPKSNVA
tara:strand:- start:11902 stop:13632 length:1731 start_codon:yes stop_codon:yes gene_type:complete